MLPTWSSASTSGRAPSAARSSTRASRCRSPRPRIPSEHRSRSASSSPLLRAGSARGRGSRSRTRATTSCGTADWGAADRHQTAVERRATVAPASCARSTRRPTPWRWRGTTAAVHRTDDPHVVRVSSEPTSSTSWSSYGDGAAEPAAGTVDETLAAAERWWDRSGCPARRSTSTPAPIPARTELERRIVLSQYLTAVNCSGALPPQETGLVANSWQGKFHLEMHWWHAAHFAPWGRPELLPAASTGTARSCRRRRRTAAPPGLRGRPVAEAGGTRRARQPQRDRPVPRLAAAAPPLLRRAAAPRTTRAASSSDDSPSSSTRRPGSWRRSSRSATAPSTWRRRSIPAQESYDRAHAPRTRPSSWPTGGGASRSRSGGASARASSATSGGRTSSATSPGRTSATGVYAAIATEPFLVRAATTPRCSPPSACVPPTPLDRPGGHAGHAGRRARQLGLGLGLGLGLPGARDDRRPAGRPGRRRSTRC